MMQAAKSLMRYKYKCHFMDSKLFFQVSLVKSRLATARTQQPTLANARISALESIFAKSTVHRMKSTISNSNPKQG
jgi:hypothetical protein